MDDVVVLDLSILAQKEDHSNVEDSENCYFEVELFPENAEQHYEYDDEVTKVLPSFSYLVQIGIAKRVNLKHPLVEELGDCGGVPPIKIEMPMF